MIKSQLITDVAKQMQKSEDEIETILNTILDNITQSLVNGERVTLARFGRFEMRSRKPKLFVNPNTDEVHHLSQMEIPCFKASNFLKSHIDNLRSENS